MLSRILPATFAPELVVALQTTHSIAMAEMMDFVLNRVYNTPDEKQKELMDGCRKQLQLLEEAVKEKPESVAKARYDTVNKSLIEAVEVFNAIDAGDSSQLVQSGLSFIMTVASLAGPSSSMVGPICTLLSSIFAVLFQNKGGRIHTKITKVIELELQQFKFDSLRARGAGLGGVVQLMIEELQHFHSEFREKGTCGYKGLEPARLDSVCELMGEFKYQAEEMFRSLAGTFTHSTGEGEIKCLTCLVGYCYVASIYIIVLSWNKILSLEISASMFDGVAGEAKALLTSASLANAQLAGVKDEAVALLESGSVADDMLAGVKDEARVILESATKALLESASMADAELTGVKDGARALLESASIVGPKLTGAKEGCKVLLESAALADTKLTGVKDDATALLDFLSDEEMLGPAGWWLGKLHVMELYRKAPLFFTPIERFRQVIGLPTTSYTVAKATAALKKCTATDKSQPSIQFLWPLFSKPDAGDNFLNPNDANENDRHFCVVNNTRWPVCFFSNTMFMGEAKPYGELLHCFNDFTKSNIHKIFTGVITVGESFRDLNNMKNVQYIQFKSSSSGVATKLVPFYDSQLDITIQRTDYAKSFFYNNQFYIVRGERKERKCGKLHRFFIEEFDAAKLKAQTVHY